MTIVRRPSPFGELLSLRQAMDRLFEDSFVRPSGWTHEGTAGLPLDVSATTDELVVQAALPGARPEDVDITVENGVLTIRGEIRSDRTSDGTETEPLIREIRRGSFSRSVALSGELEPDKASATFEHGLLTLRIPRAEQARPRQIRINPTTTAAQPSDARGTGTEPEARTE